VEGNSCTSSLSSHRLLNRVMAPTNCEAPPPPAGVSEPRWRRYTRRIIAISSLLYLGLVVVFWALLRLGDAWWPATLLMFGPRWLVALPLIGLVPAAAARRRRSLAILVLTLVLVAGPVTGFSIPFELLSAPKGVPMRILTCNLHYAENLDPNPLNTLLSETRPDIVVLQEWDTANPAGTLVLAKNGWQVHQVTQQKDPTTHFVMASRFPIRRAAVVGPDSMDVLGAVIRYELETPVGVVTVFNVHLATPRDGLQGLLQRPGQAPAKIQAGSQLRGTQSEHVAQEAGRVQGPVLLAGDFNTPLESVLFRRVWGRYSDAFSSAGWGWGYTFFHRMTAVRIDHILVGPGWHCNRCWVGPNVGSPHRPIIADVSWSADR
jgi:vancomycin resistance protein VanJ